jgi:hypothetical protein
MSLFSALHSFFYTYTYFITWRAIVEILFFSSLFYQLSLWLKRDLHHNLLIYWYSYCLIGLGAYCLQLKTISSVLFFFTPAIVMLFLMMHQEQLQKNFVALRALTPSRSPSPDWLEQLIRSCLVAVNNNKSLICVIERKDSLQDFLTSPFMFNAELHSATFDMLVTGTAYNDSTFVWLNDHGLLRGINATWKTPNDEMWKSIETADCPAWQHDALFFTAKTDAITLGIDPKHRSFTIITRGKRFENIAAHNALKFIKKLITLNETGALQYEETEQNNRHKQHHA